MNRRSTATPAVATPPDRPRPDRLHPVFLRPAFLHPDRVPLSRAFPGRIGLAFASAALAAVLAGCASPPPPPPPKPPPVLSLTIRGGSDQNPDGAGRASPVAVRVYQLSGTGKFEQADVFALKDRGEATLGAESQGSQEFLVSPGETRTATINLKPMVSSVGVAVLYRDIDRARWKSTQPAAANGVTKLTATIGRLTLTLRSEPVPPDLSDAADKAKDAADKAKGLFDKAKGALEGAAPPK